MSLAFESIYSNKIKQVDQIVNIKQTASAMLCTVMSDEHLCRTRLQQIHGNKTPFIQSIVHALVAYDMLQTCWPTWTSAPSLLSYSTKRHAKNGQSLARQVSTQCCRPEEPRALQPLRPHALELDEDRDKRRGDKHRSLDQTIPRMGRHNMINTT